jgi:hypothetical protein
MGTLTGIMLEPGMAKQSIALLTGITAIEEKLALVKREIKENLSRRSTASANDTNIKTASHELQESVLSFYKGTLEYNKHVTNSPKVATVPGLSKTAKTVQHEEIHTQIFTRSNLSIDGLMKCNKALFDASFPALHGTNNEKLSNSEYNNDAMNKVSFSAQHGTDKEESSKKKCSQQEMNWVKVVKKGLRKRTMDYPTRQDFFSENMFAHLDFGDDHLISHPTKVQNKTSCKITYKKKVIRKLT